MWVDNSKGNSIHLVWAAHSCTANWVLTCKWYEASGSFAFDFGLVRITVDVGGGKNRKVGPSLSFGCPGSLCCCSSLASIPEEKL